MSRFYSCLSPRTDQGRDDLARVEARAHRVQKHPRYDHYGFTRFVVEFLHEVDEEEVMLLMPHSRFAAISAHKFDRYEREFIAIKANERAWTEAAYDAAGRDLDAMFGFEAAGNAKRDRGPPLTQEQMRAAAGGVVRRDGDAA